MIKNVKRTELKINIATVFLNAQDDLIECKCLCCNKHQQNFDENLKKGLFNTYKFFNHDKNKIILLLQKGIYPHEYMGD